MPTTDYDTDETEDVSLHEVRVGGTPVQHIGISESGVIFVRGELHPLGAHYALLKAAGQHVPYVAVSAVEVLYPGDWLRSECAGDMDRQRVITNIETYARSGFSEGARMRKG